MARFNPDPPTITAPSYKYVIYAKGDNGQSIVSSFYFVQRAGATTTPSPQLIGDAAHLTILPAMQSITSINTTYYRTTSYRLDDPTIPPANIIFTAAGQVAGDSCPSTVAFRVRRSSAWGGQKGFGTMRIGLVAESSTLADKVAAAFDATLDLAMTQFKLPLQTVNPTDGFMDPHVLTRVFSLGPVIVPIVKGAITVDWDWFRELGSQRTRLVRPPN